VVVFPATQAQAVLFEAGQWAFCNECEKLFFRPNLDGLVDRAARFQARVNPGIAALDMAKEIIFRTILLLTYRELTRAMAVESMSKGESQ
jgi:hypothetical protein